MSKHNPSLQICREPKKKLITLGSQTFLGNEPLFDEWKEYFFVD